MAVTKTTRGETWMVNRLVTLYLYDNGPMDPSALHSGRRSNRHESRLLIGRGGAPMDH
jgi:hypothetical protein